MTSTDPVRPPVGPLLFGFPRGAWLIIAVEFMERFSFYGMLAILALFLTAPPTKGGFGWSDGEALGLLGLYSGLMYALPALGGYLADRFWGGRKAVRNGASLMVLGHFLMAAPAFFPWLLTQLSGVPVAEHLATLGVSLGRFGVGPRLAQALAGLPPATAAQVGLGYRLVTASFFLALTCLVVGNALMKSTLAVLVGDLFDPEDGRKDGAYAYYYLGIALGAMLSGVIIGSVAETFGWHYGFTVAGFGMAGALGLYVGLGPRFLGQVGIKPKAPERLVGSRVLTPAERADTWRRVTILGVLGTVLFVFSTGWFQIVGTWTLFIERSVDRTIGGFSVPTPWFVSFNSLLVIVATPFVARWLIRMEAARRRIDIVSKYVAALLLAAAANAALAMAAGGGGPGAMVGAGWPVIGISILSFGELLAWPSTYGMVYRLAPLGMASAAMGVWYLMTLGAGGYAAGEVGQLIERVGPATLFWGLAIGLAGVALVTLLIGPWLRRQAARAGSWL